jgi:hypothetical protein
MIAPTETAIIARLAARVAVGSILLGTFDAVDLTDDSTGPVVGQLRLERINAEGASVVGSAAAFGLIYSFSVYCDIAIADATEKTAAYQLLEDAARALVGWEYAPMQYPEMLNGADTGFDGRILRLSIGFLIPAIFT